MQELDAEHGLDRKMIFLPEMATPYISIIPSTQAKVTKNILITDLDHVFENSSLAVLRHLNYKCMQKAILSGAVPSSIFSPEYIATKQAGPNILSKFFSWCAAQKLFW